MNTPARNRSRSPIAAFALLLGWCATSIAPSCATSIAPSIAPSSAPTGLIAEGHDSRIDLVWDRAAATDENLWNIYRAEHRDGPWTQLNATGHSIHVYSDFVGENGKTFYYRVTRLRATNVTCRDYLARVRAGRTPEVRGVESESSRVARAATVATTDAKWLDSIQKACFRYFWDFGHPVSRLAREGFTHPRATTTTGGTGFGMLTIMVGADRGFVTRDRAARRLLTMVAFLEDRATRYHGMWSHHLDGATGRTIPFAGDRDDGADIVESAFLLQGMLAVREYFDAATAVETELRQRITRLWKGADWSFFQQPGDDCLTWHWSPNHGFALDHKIRGFNECMIAYLLAMGSATHPIAPGSYYRGWVGRTDRYANGDSYFGIRQRVGPAMGGPLFFTHYWYLALDPREITDAYTNYFENNRAISRIHRAYRVANPKGHAGYSELVWGLTASLNPTGYVAHEPGSDRDDGTIAPTAAISAMPYTPAASLAALKHFYFAMGERLWGPFGLHDAFHSGKNWVSPSFLAIDQGTIVPMIENHRTGLPWRMFMKSDVAASILQALAKARSAARLR